MTQTQIGTLEADLINRIASAADLNALEAVRVDALGKKGSISNLLKTLGGMDQETRQIEGPKINGLKQKITNQIAERKLHLEAVAMAARLEAERVDVSLPVQAGPLLSGRIHPVSQVMDELSIIFADLGFEIADGPDIETDFYNFTS